jgi:predicted TIM-barrel fold metal-dependent hydrolase
MTGQVGATAIDDLVLVSVDDHVVEPPGMFDAHVPARWRDRAPRVVHKVGPNGGFDVWSFDGRDVPNIALNAVAGRPSHRYGIDPTSFDELRPGCYDVHARVMDMSANGVLGSMCFPSFPQFCGQLFARTEDKDLALVMLQAYNDWHIDEWCGAYPERFIPLALPPIWDPELMAVEVARVAAKGCHAITFSENPAKLGYPSWHDPHWDPFFAACSDHGTVICLHIGSSSDMVVTAMNAPVTVQMSLQPLNIVQCAADIIWSRVPTEFPDLRFALSEGGIGWVPYFLERCEFTYEHHRAWTGVDLGTRTPTQVFRDHVITCFIDDPSGLELRDHIGVERITWECDYPHSDSTWPRSPEVLAPSLAGLSRPEVDAITHANATRLFAFDPFARRAREQCTVGALRAEAEGWDVSVRDIDRPWTPPDRPITQDQKLAALGRIANPATRS